MLNRFPRIEGLESRRLMAAGFQIELAFEASVSSAVRGVLQQAANRWQQVITGDVPDVGAGAWGAAVDDIRITARVKPIDGVNGGLAQTRPTFIRSGSKFPIAGEIEIDSADVAGQTNQGTLDELLTHEMAHALGFGTLWSQFSGLTTGVGGSNPLYVGSNALREYRTYANNFGLSGIPLETGGGTGTAGAHWKESVFKAELLTGFIGAGSSPLSRITIGQFADLGYQVNYNAADFYTLGTPTPTTGTVTGKVFNDLDRDGNLDANEGGLGNRGVYLDTNSSGFREATDPQATTNGNGDYTFSNVNAGNYAVRLFRGDLTQTSPANNGSRFVTVSGGQTTSGNNFGAYVGGTTPPPTGNGRITGRVYNDADRDGQLDANEAGLGNRGVYLDTNNSGFRDGSDPQATTDSGGNYSFTVAPGNYSVRLFRGDLTQTSPANNGSNFASVGAGGTSANLNFGAYGGTTPPPTTGGRITGAVFNDANRNGRFDAGEQGLANRSVYLDVNGTGFRESSDPQTLTNSGGGYSFNVAPGNYAVRLFRGDLTQIAPTNNGSFFANVSSGATVGNLNFATVPSGFAWALARAAETPERSRRADSIFGDDESIGM